MSSSWTDEAFEVIRRGDYHRALAILHNVEVAGSTVMRALAWDRLGRTDRVIAECTRRADADYDAHEIVQLLGLHANALLEEGDEARARAALGRQRHLAKMSRERLLVAYAAYCETLASYTLGDSAGAWRSAWEASAALSALHDVPPKRHHHLDLFSVRARLYHIEGWLHGRAGAFEAQEARFIEAARVAGDERCRDRMIESAILANLAVRMKRKYAPASRALLSARVAAYPAAWLADSHVTEVRLALETASRLYGGATPPRFGGPSAPTLSLRLSDRVSALLFDDWAAPHAFIEESRFCISMLFEINLGGRPGKEVCDILELAALIAPFDLALAHRARDIFRDSRRQLSRFIASVDAPSELASRYFVDGCLAKAGGDERLALECYGRALRLELAGDGHPLPALAGIERYTLSGSVADLAPARAFVAAFRDAPFSRRLRRALAAAERCAPAQFPYLGMYGVARGAAGNGRGSRAETLTSLIRADRTA